MWRNFPNYNSREVTSYVCHENHQYVETSIEAPNVWWCHKFFFGQLILPNICSDMCKVHGTMHVQNVLKKTSEKKFDAAQKNSMLRRIYVAKFSIFNSAKLVVRQYNAMCCRAKNTNQFIFSKKSASQFCLMKRVF